MKQSMVGAKRTTKALVMTTLVVLGACDASDSATGPEDPPTVVVGRVASVSSSTGPSSSASASRLGGIEVSVEGSLAADITDDDGSFRLELEGDGGPIRLRFRRGTLDVELELTGLPAGGELRIEVRLDDGGATVLDDDDDTDDDGADGGAEEFQGSVALVSVEGEASARTALLELTSARGSVLVRVQEDATLFDGAGDIHTFAGLIASLEQNGSAVRMEGRGSLDADGVFTATAVKVEVDDDDGAPNDGPDDDPVGFDGLAALLLLEGEAPLRVALVELEGELGVTQVRVVEGVTSFDIEGDVLDFAQLLSSLKTWTGRVRIEGDGSLGADGVFAAARIKVEVDEGS